MKVKCRRDGLLGACQLAGLAVAARTTKPILANLKAVAADDALILMATDLEVGIRYELRGVDVARGGAAILPAAKLISILRECSDEDISIDADESSSLVRTASGRFSMPAGDPAEFPDVAAFDAGGRYHEVTAGVLETLIRRTAFAADKKESGARWAVTGVLWEADNATLKLVATDTKRLAMCTGPAAAHGEGNDSKDKKPSSHLLPQKAMQLLERCLSDRGESIRVALNTNDVMFQTERAVIVTRLVEGKFPPYDSIIPKKCPIKVALPVPDFQQRVRQAAIMTDEATKRVDFEFESGKLTLKAEGAEIGSSEVVLHLPDYTGEDITIAFDPGYVLEMLRAIEGETSITLEMSSGEKPAVFRTGDGYLYLVMPLTG